MLNEFLNFLDSSKNAAAPSSKKADHITSIFLNKTTDTKVLADIALAAQYKLCIYWSMPPSNRTYWKSLYKNCRKKLGNNQTEEESYLLASLDCNCGHQPVFTDADSNQVLRKQLIASHVMDKFLIHLDSIRRKPNEIEAELVLKTNPILSNLSDYNVLTDIAVTANYRNRLYRWVVTPEKRLHRALFWSSVNQIALKSDWKASAALASIMHLTHAQSSTLLRLTEIQASQRNLRSQKEHH